MILPHKVIRLRLATVLLSVITTILLVSAFWLFFIFLSYAGLPFPDIAPDRFLDLSFFSFSTLSFIIFLTITPFQAVAQNLSPGFYARMIRNTRSHFSLYLLLNCSIICFLAIAFYQTDFEKKYLSQLYTALTASMITAIWFHRIWALRYLHEPYNVYANIEKLMKEESPEEVWTEMIECSYKAIRDSRLSDSKNFISVLDKIYAVNSMMGNRTIMHEDLKSLHEKAKGLRPVLRYMEVKWPFLRLDDKA